MGSSKYMTIDQAAAVLGVSRRTIHRYTERGLLSGKCEGRHTLISEDDLRLVKKGRKDISASPVRRDMVLKLQVEVETLKSHMATVMRILNIRYQPLNFTVPEYETFYKAAVQMSEEGWAPHSEEMWADYFVRITVEDLEGIELASEDKHPWRPLLRLATTMHMNPYNKELTDVFAAGRTNMKHIAGMWCILRGESPRTFDLLQDRDAAPLKKLVRRLKKDQS